jgi:hypothetical protein
MPNIKDTSLSHFIKIVMKLNSENNDILTRYGDLRFTSQGVLVIRDGDKLTRYENLSELFILQLLARLKIPSIYFDRIKEIPGLRAKNLNTILKFEENTGCLIRFQDNTARAFLSSKYLRIDHIYVLNEFLESFKQSCKTVNIKYENPIIKMGWLSNKKMYVAVLPQKNGAECSQGIGITNSEVGQGAFQVYNFIYFKGTGSIFNGGIIWRRHIGKRQNTLDDVVYNNMTLRQEMEHLRNGVLEACKSIKYGIYKRIIDNFEKHMDVSTEDPMKVLSEWIGMYSILKKYKIDLVNRINVGEWKTEKSTLKSLIKFTEEIEDYEDAFDIKRVGWDILMKSTARHERNSAK